MPRSSPYDNPPDSSQRAIDFLWNVLTSLVLMGGLCLISYFALVFISPNSSLNPFPPPTFPGIAIVLPSPTIGPAVTFAPTWTASPTMPPTVTNTPRPTATLPPTNTPFSLVTPTITFTPKPTQGPAFALEQNSPIAIANIAHPEAGCNWMGVAGQVKDIKGSAISGQQVLLGGALGGVPVNKLTLTGLAPQYGAGYFEFTLMDRTKASQETLWIQLLDQAGLPMSTRIPFDTYDDCTKNLIIINFRQARQ